MDIDIANFTNAKKNSVNLNVHAISRLFAPKLCLGNQAVNSTKSVLSKLVTPTRVMTSSNVATWLRPPASLQF